MVQPLGGRARLVVSTQPRCWLGALTYLWCARSRRSHVRAQGVVGSRCQHYMYEVLFTSPDLQLRQENGKTKPGRVCKPRPPANTEQPHAWLSTCHGSPRLPRHASHYLSPATKVGAPMPL